MICLKSRRTSRMSGGGHHELRAHGVAAGGHDGSVPGGRLPDRRRKRRADRVLHRARHERLGVLELGQDGAAHAPGAAGDPGLGAGAGRHGRAAGAPRRPADAGRVLAGDQSAERVRHRPQSAEQRGRGDARAGSVVRSRGAGRGDLPRARPHQEPRHPDHDHHGDARRRDRLSGRSSRSSSGATTAIRSARSAPSWS